MKTSIVIYVKSIFLSLAIFGLCSCQPAEVPVSEEQHSSLDHSHAQDDQEDTPTAESSPAPETKKETPKSTSTSKTEASGKTTQQETDLETNKTTENKEGSKKIQIWSLDVNGLIQLLKTSENVEDRIAAVKDLRWKGRENKTEVIPTLLEILNPEGNPDFNLEIVKTLDELKGILDPTVRAKLFTLCRNESDIKLLREVWKLFLKYSKKFSEEDPDLNQVSHDGILTIYESSREWVQTLDLNTRKDKFKSLSNLAKSYLNFFLTAYEMASRSPVHFPKDIQKDLAFGIYFMALWDRWDFWSTVDTYYSFKNEETKHFLISTHLLVGFSKIIVESIFNPDNEYLNKRKEIVSKDLAKNSLLFDEPLFTNTWSAMIQIPEWFYLIYSSATGQTSLTEDELAEKLADLGLSLSVDTEAQSEQNRPGNNILENVKASGFFRAAVAEAKQHVETFLNTPRNIGDTNWRELYKILPSTLKREGYHIDQAETGFQIYTSRYDKDGFLKVSRSEIYEGENYDTEFLSALRSATLLDRSFQESHIPFQEWEPAAAYTLQLLQKALTAGNLDLKASEEYTRHQEKRKEIMIKLGTIPEYQERLTAEHL